MNAKIALSEDAKRAEITRICGCKKTVHIQPGTGGTWDGTPSRAKYARRIALSACRECEAQLSGIATVKKWSL